MSGTHRHEALCRKTGSSDPARPASLAALNVPLIFDPGDRWEYGMGMDWVGQLIEMGSGRDDRRLFPRDHIFVPAWHAR